MREYLLLIVALFAVLPLDFACAQEPNDIHSEHYWQTRLNRVRIGMARARAQRILGCGSIYIDTETPAKFNRWPDPGAHTSLYPLDARWCAAITFDWYGYDPDPKRNPHMVFHFPEHRVIAKPRLLPRNAALNSRLHQ